MGMSGKPDGLCGSDVETHFRDGRIQEIADYCENDVVNTYRVTSYFVAALTNRTMRRVNCD
jgi:predicted PolB exonuclease-like 3'-5' exonuclease